MCRMLACLTTEGLPGGLLTQFRRLSHEGKVPPKAAPGHVSGWGIFASDFGGSTLYYRSNRDAWDDPSFDRVIEVVENLSGARAFMVHLRKASVGTPRAVNSHPFAADGRVFMHNGSIRGLSRSFTASRMPLGQTDSEKFFLLLLDSLEDKEMPEALSEVLPKLEELDYSSLTFIMQDGPLLFAYRHFGRCGDYYTLYYAQTRGSVLFSSEPLTFKSEWHPIRNRELIQARLYGSRLQVKRCVISQPVPGESVIHRAAPRQHA
jgi:predicted glutamine amidotransferase